MLFRALVFVHLAFAVTLPGAVLATSLGPRQSGPIALADNGSFFLNVNPPANSVSLFDVSSDQLKKVAEIPVGRDPRSVTIHPNNVTAYVANSYDGTVSVIDVPSRLITKTIRVGAEPMAVVLSPNGSRLYVANSASNNLMVINTVSQAIAKTVDLSPYGTAPRALAVTNNGDTNDQDETIFAALFFAQLRTGKTSIAEGQDDQREGRVVAISAATDTPLGFNPIRLEPVAYTGFKSNGKLVPERIGGGFGAQAAVTSTNPQTFTTLTGAFPNQLAAIAIRPLSSQAYVVSTGASPNGPFRFDSNVQGLVSIFDTGTGSEVTAGQTDTLVRRTAPLNLNRGINLATTPEPRLFLSNPVAMAWRPNGSDAWIVIQNSDLVVRLTVNGSGIPTIGAPLVAGPSSLVRVDLQNVPTSLTTESQAPRGIVINAAGTRAYVANFIARSVTAIDISNPQVPVIHATAGSTALPQTEPEATAHRGASLFFTGRGRMSKESWGGCVTCHPGGLSDNVTWMFDAGPRQTVSLDGTFGRHNPDDQRILNWSAVRDEIQDFELNIRDVSGGQGLNDDDRLFLALGGAGGSTPQDQALAEQFQQFTGVVGKTNDLDGGKSLAGLAMHAARRDFAVATLADDRVFIFGGRSGSGNGSLVSVSEAVIEFNPRTNTVTPRSAVGFTRRHSLGAAAVRTSAGFRIYTIGGYASTSSSASPVQTVQEYNPDTNTWRTVASLPTAVAQFGITVAGGIDTAEPLQLIHVVSGNTGSEGAPSVANPNPVQRFQADPAGPGNWSAFNPGLTLRRNHGLATAFRGVQSRVFVIGGQNASGTVLDTVEEYSAQTVIVEPSPHTPLPSPRAQFGIGSLLSTNQIYVMGGINAAGADQSTILEYTIANNGPTAGDPGRPSGTWAIRSGHLSVARHGLQTTTPPGVTNFLPVQSAGRNDLLDAIAVFLERDVRPSRAPVHATNPDAVAGRALFGTVGLVNPGFSCATCHGGAKWTRSVVDYLPPPSPEVGIGLGNERIIGAELRQTAAQGANVLMNVGTFILFGGRVNEIRFNSADISQVIAPLGVNGFNIPSLLSVHETAPYFHSGLAQTLEEVLNGSQEEAVGVASHFVTDASKRAELIAFLRSIDNTTTTFP